VTAAGKLGGTLYESDAETKDFVVEQLGRSARSVESFGQLHFVAGEPVPSYWHRNVWFEPEAVAAASISEAAEALRSRGALWAARPQDRYRRHELIQQKLPRLRYKPRSFPFTVPTGGVGAWCLRDETTVWASAQTSSPFPGGDPLLEDREDPPSSAYKKLQEALLLLGRLPRPGERCLDAGASPGGWTWVLAETGAQVRAVDRAPLDSSLTVRSTVESSIGNAFTLKPADFGPLDWFCSDVVCYPAKLWTWLEPWIESGTVKNFVVTVKFQGKETDWETLDRFAAVPGSRLVHLHHNKHELTWMK
jgi:23S rRNA (cytidine2498-2'-O)-methyltransferase